MASDLYAKLELLMKKVEKCSMEKIEVKKDRQLFDVVGCKTDEKNLHEKALCTALRNPYYSSIVMNNIRDAYFGETA